MAYRLATKQVQGPKSNACMLALTSTEDLFVALVPEQVHSDTGLACNYMTWLSRGL